MPKSTRCGLCGKPIKGHTRRAGMVGGKGGGRAIRIIAKEAEAKGFRKPQ